MTLALAACGGGGGGVRSRPVDPFIGTATFAGAAGSTSGWFDGNTFPGATTPFGMVQFSADNSGRPGGYNYDSASKVDALSLTHFSGRGVRCWLDVGLMPVAAAPVTSPGADWSKYASRMDHAKEAASPGRYSVELLDHGVRAELTATARTGVARFTFPKNAAAHLLVNAGHSGSGNEAAGTGVQIKGTNQITGSVRSGNCGGTFPYRIYFFAELDHPFATLGTWAGTVLSPDSREAAGAKSGAYVGFDLAGTGAPEVQARIGLSFVSVEHAEANLRAETSGKSFDQISAEAEASWDGRLAAVEIEGGTDAQRTVFYTALYHSMLHPNVFSDHDGSYLGFDGQVHVAAEGHAHYENFPAWDNYRSLMPLLAIVAPAEAADMMQSLVNMAAQDPGGGLPRWQQANGNSGGMVGDGQCAAMAGVRAFGVTGFDAAAALAAMERGATDPAATSGGHAVREGLTDYLAKGYVPDQAAVTLEYLTNDFAIGQLAGALGDQPKKALYESRAGKWEMLFDQEQGGYLVPRAAGGAFKPAFSPSSQSGFVEGTGAQYLWMVPHDLGGLVAKLGGNAAAVARLDRFFEKLNDGPDSEHAFMGNEPEEIAPWVYDFAGAPWKTQALTRRILNELFPAVPGGLPGNDDAGALSSWAVFASLGLYPGVPGVGGFLVGSPLFPRAVVHLAGGKRLVIEAPAAATGASFVHGLTVDGVAHGKPWIPWASVSGGATLGFDLAKTPDETWGSKPEDAPPSLARP